MEMFEIDKQKNLDNFIQILPTVDRNVRQDQDVTGPSWNLLANFARWNHQVNATINILAQKSTWF